MDEKSSRTWAPGWNDRLADAVHSLGFKSLSDLLSTMPSRTYDAVANQLGPFIAPIQITITQYNEAKAAGRVREAAKDALCREIVDKFPDGWGVGENPDWQSIMALSGWSSRIIGTAQCEHLEPFADAIVQAFRRSPPPHGWRPTGPDDPVIVSAFDKLWPKSATK